MVALTSAPYMLFFILWTFHGDGLAETETMTVTVGDDATLSFRCPRNISITKCVWSRSDLKTGGYVFFFRDDRPNQNILHPQFQGRVELKHKDMQDGDVSVVLRKVSSSDSGTYLCRVLTDSNKVYNHSIRLEVIAGLTVIHSGDRGDVDSRQRNNVPMATTAQQSNAWVIAVIVGVIAGVIVVIGVIVLRVRLKLRARAACW